MDVLCQYLIMSLMMIDLPRSERRSTAGASVTVCDSQHHVKQCSVVQYSTVQCSAMQCSAESINTRQYVTVRYIISYDIMSQHRTSYHIE